MGHDASKIQMGSTASTFKDVSNHKGTIAAGLAAVLKSDDTLSSAKADGGLIGISLGKSQSADGRTPVVRAGTRVPVLLGTGFNPVIGAQVHISDTTGKAVASGAGATGMNAIYSSTKKTAIGEDGAAIADGAAYIDFIGGL